MQSKSEDTARTRNHADNIPNEPGSAKAGPLGRGAGERWPTLVQAQHWHAHVGRSQWVGNAPLIHTHTPLRLLVAKTNASQRQHHYTSPALLLVSISSGSTSILPHCSPAMHARLACFDWRWLPLPAGHFSLVTESRNGAAHTAAERAQACCCADADALTRCTHSSSYVQPSQPARPTAARRH